jgi:choline dehydrogenase-like flavoprotein
VGVIVQGHEVGAPLSLRTHTLVVGSGAGGAVMAALLAEAGVDVLVVEEGGHFTARDFTQREEEMFPALYRGGGQQLTEDGTINVLQGSCFGGSTVINMADCVPTPPEVFAHWRRLLGLTELDQRSLEPSVQRVFARLQVNRIAPEQVNANNRALVDGARALGLSAGVFDHNRTGCHGSGYCLIGCAYDAKKGAHLNYLPAALAAGAGAYTDVRVERLERLSVGGWTAHGAVVERGPRTARLPVRIQAERVVLAAGAVHTPAILARSGLGRGLPQLGHNVSLQPQLPVVAAFDESRRIELWRGVPQSAYCDAFDDNRAEHGLGGFRLEAVHGGIANAASLLPGFGAAHKDAMRRLAHTAVALLLVPDRPSGRIRWDWTDRHGVRPRIAYRATAEWEARLRRGLRHAAELYFAAGARQVVVPHELFEPLRSPDELARIDGFRIVPAITHLISAHVQGTCRMSLDASGGVVDQDHRVHGVPGLYVVDASVMPTTASTHTMIPIMALADRAAHRMLRA